MTQEEILECLKTYHSLLDADLAHRITVDADSSDIPVIQGVVFGIEICIGICSGAEGPVNPRVLQEFGRAIATEDYRL